jgi:hypothetical protein
MIPLLLIDNHTLRGRYQDFEKESRGVRLRLGLGERPAYGSACVGWAKTLIKPGI